MNKLIQLSKKIIKHKSFQNFLIIGTIAGVQLLNNVILGRNLSKENFGLYSLVFLNITRLFSVLFLFGQNASVVRYFSSRKLDDYHWKGHLAFFLLIIIVPIIGASYIVKYVYELTWFWFTMVLCGSYLLCCTKITSSIIVSAGNFNLSMLLERINPVLFQLLLFIPMFILPKLMNDFIFISTLKFTSLLIIVPVLFYFFFFKRNGKKKINKKNYLDGLNLWEMSLTVLVLTYLDALFIPKILDYKELALFNILLSVMQIFEFARESVFNVYSQKFSKNHNINILKMFKVISAICLLISIFYILGTNLILDILFAGKYTASMFLIILFCISGSINLLYVIPSCYFLGQSNKREIHQQMGGNIGSIIIKIVLIFSLRSLMLPGFMIAAIISQGFRTIMAYYILFRKKK